MTEQSKTEQAAQRDATREKTRADLKAQAKVQRAKHEERNQIDSAPEE